VLTGLIGYNTESGAMVIQIKLSSNELKAVHKKSALKGISIDEFIHDAILQAIEEEMQTRDAPSQQVDTVKKVNHKVYQPGVDPYAPVFEESEWVMFCESEVKLI
jgi:hypothetical protein